MTSEEPRRSGIDHLLAGADFRDRDERWGGFAFEVKFHRFLQAGDGFLARRAEAGNIHVEALGDDEFVFAPDAAGHGFHEAEATPQRRLGQRGRGGGKDEIEG